MNERIKELRKALEESQDSFASKLNLSRNFVWMIEKGEREPSDRTIKDICRIYNVNETWLRTGKGEMYAPASREQRIAQLVAKLFNEESNPHMINIINVVTEMSDDQIELLIDVAKKLAKEEEET